MTEYDPNQRTDFTNWEGAYTIMQKKYLEQHKKAVRYKEALEAIAAMQDLDEPSIVRMCRMIAIAEEALKDDP